MFTISRFLLLSFSCAAVLAQYGDDGYGPPSPPPAPPAPEGPPPQSSSAIPATPSSSTSAASDSSGRTGDTQCSSLMCVSAVVNGDTVQYTLQSTGSLTLGWMAMGFGTAMSNAAMVVMWPNADGTVTISQRRAPGEQMPTLDSSPPRVATASADLSDASASKPQLVYTIPANSDTKQDIVWAFGTRAPSSAAKDATFQQHADSGRLTLDLTKSIQSGSASPSSPSQLPSSGILLAPYQKIIIAHAIFSVFGFLLILPAGALLARYFRNFSNSWFKGHWILQFGVGAPVILTGIMLGIGAVVSAGARHVDDTHKKCGIILLVLYLMQCALGAVIHWVKPKSFVGRPPQNYLHAVLGLAIIGLAFYQVRTGYKTEWPTTTGLADLPRGVDYVWYIWIVLLPLLYAGGLFFLRRQYAQERRNRQKAAATQYSEIGLSQFKPRY